MRNATTFGARSMFSAIEREYLTARFLGRLATLGPGGTPQLRPLGYRLNSDDTIDLGGPRVAATQRYRNVVARPGVSFVVDDMTPDEPSEVKPGMGRGIEIRGVAEPVTVEDSPGARASAGSVVLRVHPKRILSWHIDHDDPGGHSRTVA